MPRMARALVLPLSALLLTGLLTPLPGGAAEIPRATPATRPLLQRMLDVRDAMRDGSLLGALAATADVDLRPAASTPIRIPGLPPQLAGPIGTLLGAVETAGDLAEKALLDPAAFARARRLATDRTAFTGGGVGRIQRLLDLAVDAETMQRAGATVAAALDVVLPLLHTVPATGSGEGCDVLDLTPQLCVAGDGDNTLTEDAALVIDLGGDDVHLHGAGAANGLGGVPVSLTVDLDGNDTYRRTGPPWVAQGAAIIGVGMLVDEAGDDRYEIESPAGNEGDGFLWGQGASQAGVALLADRAGSDTYEVAVERAARGFVRVLGSAELGGTSVLTDGGGDDAYHVRVVGTYREVGDGISAGAPYPWAGGVSDIAQAAFHDAGGRDDLVVEALTPPIAPDDPRPIVQGSGSPGVAAFGAGSLTCDCPASVAIFGPGETTRTIRATAAAPRAPGGGVVGLGSTEGGLLDEGGSDTNLIEVSVTSAAERTVDDACGCEPRLVVSGGGGRVRGMGENGGALWDRDGDDRYALTLHRTVDARLRDERTEGAGRVLAEAEAHSWAQVHGQGANRGVLRDDAGDDTYEMDLRVDVTAEATSRRSDALVEARAEAIEGPGSTRPAIGAEAVGQGADGGLLEDLAGDDRYIVTTALSSTSRSRQGPELDLPGEAVAIATAADAVVQGAALEEGEPAVLHDHGGTDRYEVRTEVEHRADPPTEEYRFLPPRALAQGAADEQGVALFADTGDGGAEDVFLTEPERAACEGDRGRETWRDCGGRLALGHNNGAPVPEVPATVPGAPEPRMPASTAGPCAFAGVPGAHLVPETPVDDGCELPSNPPGVAPPPVQHCGLPEAIWEKERCATWTSTFDGTGDGRDGQVFPSAPLAVEEGRAYVTGYTWSEDGVYELATFAYDPDTGEELWRSGYRGPGAQSIGVAVAAAGDRLFVSGYSDAPGNDYDLLLIAHDASTGDLLWSSRYDRLGGQDYAGLGRSVAVSPDGSTVFVTGTTSQWEFVTFAHNAATGERLWETIQPPPHNYLDAHGIAVSPDGETVVVTGNGLGSASDCVTVAYDAGTGERRWYREYDGWQEFTDTSWPIAMHPDGHDVYVGCAAAAIGASNYDALTIAYDVETGARRWVQRYNRPGRKLEDWPAVLAVSPDGKRVAMGGTSTYELWWNGFDFDYLTAVYDTESGEELWVARWNSGVHGEDHGSEAITGLGFAPDGEQLYVTGFSAAPNESREDPGPGESAVTIAYGSEGQILWAARDRAPGATERVPMGLVVDPGAGRSIITGPLFDLIASAALDPEDIRTVAYGP